MAWITPKTDWLETDRCTYSDMNRIAGNVNELCGTSLKADYTQNDAVTLAEWRAIISALVAKAEEAGYVIIDEIGESVTAENFNAAESVTFGTKARIELLARQASAAIYSGDGFYVGENRFLR